MVSRILHAGRSYRAALEYNVTKVFRGVASQVDYRNLPDGNLNTVWNAFRELENNQAVSRRMRAFGFHVALNPSESDGITNAEVLDLCHEMMEALGYGSQPYVVYKHNDIEREHFHVVSMRVAPDGRSLSTPFDARQLMAFLRSVQQKYHFTLGKGEEQVKARDEKEERGESVSPLKMVPQRFRPEVKNVGRQLVTMYSAALEWNFISLAQFHAVLLSMGLYASLYKQGRRFLLKGVDEKGNATSRPYNLDREFGVESKRLYDEALRENQRRRGETARSRIKTMTVCEFALRKAGSLEEFEKICSECGLFTQVVMAREGDVPAAVLLCDARNKAVFFCDELGRDCHTEKFAEKLRAGQWPPVDERRKEELSGRKLVTRSEIGTLYQKILRACDALDEMAERQGSGLGLGRR